MKRKFARMLGALTALGLAASWPAAAGERPIGDPVEKNGMEIAAVYLQAVTMEPDDPAAKRPDVHIEADIRALMGNNNGFGAGEWIPYLDVAYTIEKAESDWSASGLLVPMVASDGPHYGANVALDGPGTYELAYRIAPPIQRGFYRHTDKETGVGQWWAPFQTEWTFVFIGAGKKGGY